MVPNPEHDPNAKVGQRGHMSNYASPHGKPEGMAARLRDHMKRLGTDKSLPWVGLGLIDDLACAASMLDGEPTSKHAMICEGKPQLFAQLAQTPRPTNDPAPVATPELEDWEKLLRHAGVANVEFDL